MLLVLVKPESTADYEAAIEALQGVLSTTTDARRKSMAQGWRVFRAAEPDAKGNVVYVHALFPAVAGADYRPSLILDELMTEMPEGLLEKYSASLAGPPSRLSLHDVATMSVAPVKKAPPGK